MKKTKNDTKTDINLLITKDLWEYGKDNVVHFAVLPTHSFLFKQRKTKINQILLTRFLIKRIQCSPSKNGNIQP